ncbi:MAG: CoA transferase [Marinovum algicola]|jgi:CoA:oxalate CoA-transferase|uniref:CoA:oxalate CoA-transferase n=1 Tax=Marinovum algicola TaxID=42444 RepID=A0A975W8J4_9RHOB|nr:MULTISPECIES: CoA transferase [Marinovum]AKO97044.1 putative acyl-CoA transferase/carnitine dehydratase [Marinovum algicola DG 898]MDD9740887.1 CoA transferase [Marinovum sp. SP66]SEJ11210.1 CoA:oxalate CoA-transferase [Marinovum algicola]SLN21082.1 Formyl-coenzyme A transferase [Marinovum algicola]
MPNPLANVTVLDLTHVLAGPFATMTLADLGARVIKVERPRSGDDTRAFPPFKDGKSAYFSALNHSKKSIALDLKAEDDRAVFHRLLARADVIVENFRPGVMERLGYGWRDLHAAYPRLIYGAVSGFGHTGPDARRPAYDMVAQARGGVMSITGEAGGDPVRVGASIGDIVAGMYLTQGVLAALFDRETTGKGRKIDVAMLDSQLAILEHAIAITTATGTPPGRTGARHPSITPFETFHASDGLFVIAAGNDQLFERLCVCLALPIAEDPRFATNPARCKNARLLKRLIEAVTLDNTAAFWIAKLGAAGIPTAPIQDVAQVLKDPQIEARRMVVDVLDRNGRHAFTAAGNPIKLSGMEDRTTRRPAPDLDGNRGEILHWLEDDTGG